MRPQIQKLIDGRTVTKQLNTMMSAVAHSGTMAGHVKDNRLNRSDRDMSQGRFVPLAKVLPTQFIPGVSQDVLKEQLPKMQAQVGLHMAEGADASSPYIKALRMEVEGRKMLLQRKSPEEEFNWGQS